MLLWELQVAPIKPECLKALVFINQFLADKFFPEKAMTLEDSGNIPLVTIVDSALTRHLETQQTNKNAVLITSYAVHE